MYKIDSVIFANYAGFCFSGQFWTFRPIPAGGNRKASMFLLNDSVAHEATPVSRGVRPQAPVQRTGFGVVKKACVGVAAVAVPALAQAQTDATVIATNAQSAFNTIAPICVTIAGFWVILRLAKRVVK